LTVILLANKKAKTKSPQSLGPFCLWTSQHYESLDSID